MSNEETPYRKRGRVLTVVALLASTGSLLSTVPDAAAIVNGTLADEGQHPYQVALEDEFGQFCGGALIAADAVVTAAHCLEDLSPTDISIHSGIVDLGEAGQRRDVVRMVVHPAWNESGGNSNDIAILFLASAFELDARTAVIDARSAAVDANSIDGTVAVVSGWGAPGENSNQSTDDLLRAEVPVVGDQQCQRLMRREGDSIDPSTMLCAGGDLSDSCYGDSGGPLAVRQTNGSFVLIGVVSWGIACAFDGVPGVYAEVAQFQQWLNRELATTPHPKPAPSPAPNPEPAPKPAAIVTVFKQNTKMRVPSRGGFGEAARFPAIQEVSGVGNELTDIDVVLRGFKHGRPSDLDIILVSPSGTEVTLMSDTGGNKKVKRLKIRFDDDANRSIPDSGVRKGRYLPTSNTPDMPSTDLSAFEGEDPNGEWELYAFDAVRGKRGKIKKWQLIVTAR